MIDIYKPLPEYREAWILKCIELQKIDFHDMGNTENKKQCDGTCLKDGLCEGEVKTVIVSGNGFSGGFSFNYCETAILVDRENGFTVTIK